MSRIAARLSSVHAVSAVTGLLMMALLPELTLAQSSNPGYGATASGSAYYPFELPNGTVEASEDTVYSTGGPGTILAAGNGATGAGSAADAPVYSYGNIATGTLYATGNWATEYGPNPVDLPVGPTSGTATIFDTILSFTGVSAGAIGQFVINAPLASISGTGQVSMAAYLSSGMGGYGAGIMQSLGPTGGSLTTTSTVSGYCNCTTPDIWTTSVSVPFQIVAGMQYTLEETVTAQTGETNPIALYPTPGISYGEAEIDPTWSLILPAGVSYTTASGYLVGVAPVPLPASVLMLSLGLSLLALIPRRRVAAR